MSGWVDFRMLKQSIDIEQVLGAYGIELRRVGQPSTARAVSATNA